jgi:hypothetical protein
MGVFLFLALEVFMTKSYLHVAWVSGYGEVPFDMLRRDKCWPYEESDSALMSVSPIDRNERHTFRVAKIGDKMDGFTVDRWKSFNWLCRPDPPRII